MSVAVVALSSDLDSGTAQCRPTAAKLHRMRWLHRSVDSVGSRIRTQVTAKLPRRSSPAQANLRSSSFVLVVPRVRRRRARF
ncbi:hypothetical protein EVAR_38053_1 [Eumeta japonica]|uniref:Uncharacterized protein n=1 Tax=Eumeta variegata TaxID=151549 RepID=A0A4C1W9U2_EUMVA|nr:hypothetical protein EVAR_38053_1 [Eumeta japonica]